MHSQGNKGIIRDGFVFGVPDLVVEILSEITARRDKTIKKAGCEKFGVKEYWLAATLGEDDVLVSAAVPCLSLELSKVFEDEL